MLSSFTQFRQRGESFPINQSIKNVSLYCKMSRWDQNRFTSPSAWRESFRWTVPLNSAVTEFDFIAQVWSKHARFTDQLIKVDGRFHTFALRLVSSCLLMSSLSCRFQTDVVHFSLTRQKWWGTRLNQPRMKSLGWGSDSRLTEDLMNLFLTRSDFWETARQKHFLPAPR